MTRYSRIVWDRAGPALASGPALQAGRHPARVGPAHQRAAVADRV